MSCKVTGAGSLSSLRGAWSKSTTAQAGFRRLRLSARFSACVFTGGSPSQILEQADLMPQKDGSSDWEDPSELPSDGESLNTGWSKCFMSGAAWAVTSPRLRPTAPLHSSGADWKQGFSVSTRSGGFSLRRRLCVWRGEKKKKISVCSSIQFLCSNGIDFHTPFCSLDKDYFPRRAAFL